MSDGSEDVEIQKLRLERDRLAFETRKFDEDRPRREQELAKLSEEIRELRRPWYQRPSYLGPLATICVALVGGMIAFGTDVFKSNVIALRSERNHLAQSVRGLTSEKSKLSAENSALRQDAGLLKKDVENLNSRISLLAAQKQALSREILLAELKTHLRLMQSLPQSDHLGRENQSLQSLLVIVDQTRSDPGMVATLLDAYRSNTSLSLGPLCASHCSGRQNFPSGRAICGGCR
jgi:hypothetical protein